MSVFVVLGLIWAAVLVPPALRTRSGRRAEFIESFSHQMGALNQRRAQAVETPRPARQKARVSPVQRRRDIIGGLLGAMMGALVLGALPSLRVAWIFDLFLVNAFLGYVAMLAQQRKPVAPRYNAARRAEAPEHVPVATRRPRARVTAALDASR